jgi:hypothetical protein
MAKRLTKPTGRPKGAKNKATEAGREALARFIDGSTGKLQAWLDKIEKVDGPQAAFKCWALVVDHHIPKLARQEVVGDDSAPVKIVVTWLPPEQT